MSEDVSLETGPGRSTDGVVLLVRDAHGRFLFVRSAHWGWSLPGVALSRFLLTPSIATAALHRLHVEVGISPTEARLLRVLEGDRAAPVRKLAGCERTFVFLVTAWRGQPLPQLSGEEVAWLPAGASVSGEPADAAPEWIATTEEPPPLALAPRVQEVPSVPDDERVTLPELETSAALAALSRPDVMPDKLAEPSDDAFSSAEPPSVV